MAGWVAEWAAGVGWVLTQAPRGGQAQMSAGLGMGAQLAAC